MVLSKAFEKSDRFTCSESCYSVRGGLFKIPLRKIVQKLLKPRELTSTKKATYGTEIKFLYFERYFSILKDS